MDLNKRRFYNSEDCGTKGFTRRDFYNAVKAMANGEDIDDHLVELISQAAAFELETLDRTREKSGSTANGEHKDPLHSDFANGLRNAIMPFVNGTPQTAQELSDAAAAKGKMAPSGKAYPALWISRILSAEPGVVCVNKIVDKVNSKGLKSQSECKAYKRG